MLNEGSLEVNNNQKLLTLILEAGVDEETLLSFSWEDFKDLWWHTNVYAEGKSGVPLRKM